METSYERKIVINNASETGAHRRQGLGVLSQGAGKGDPATQVQRSLEGFLCQEQKEINHRVSGKRVAQTSKSIFLACVWREGVLAEQGVPRIQSFLAIPVLILYV